MHGEDVRLAAEDLFRRGRSVEDVQRALGAASPSRRTLYRWRAQALASRPLELRGEPWRFQPPSTPDPALVLPVVGYAAVITGGIEHEVDEATARWITAIRRVAPDLHPFNAGMLAQRLAWNPDDARAVALYLGIAPWRDDAAGAAYVRALEAGTLPDLDRFPLPVRLDGRDRAVISIRTGKLRRRRLVTVGDVVMQPPITASG